MAIQPQTRKSKLKTAKKVEKKTILKSEIVKPYNHTFYVRDLSEDKKKELAELLNIGQPKDLDINEIVLKFGAKKKTSEIFIDLSGRNLSFKENPEIFENGEIRIGNLRSLGQIKKGEEEETLSMDKFLKLLIKDAADYFQKKDTHFPFKDGDWNIIYRSVESLSLILIKNQGYHNSYRGDMVFYKMGQANSKYKALNPILTFLRMREKDFNSLKETIKGIVEDVLRNLAWIVSG
jgi:hypothetical protein